MSFGGTSWIQNMRLTLKNNSRGRKKFAPASLGRQYELNFRKMSEAELMQVKLRIAAEKRSLKMRHAAALTLSVILIMGLAYLLL